MLALLALLGLIFFVSRGCQQSQIRVSQAEALSIARSAVNFTPDDAAVRLLRQGLSTKPFWIVVLYTRTHGDLTPRAQVFIDAKSGEVTRLNIAGKRPQSGPSPSEAGTSNPSAGGGRER
ncbi:MAG: hypothetical protein U0R52_00065 [Solirubrobacterales bacterium]